MKIVLSAVLALLLVGCGSEENKQTKQTPVAKQEVKTVQKEVVVPKETAVSKEAAVHKETVVKKEVKKEVVVPPVQTEVVDKKIAVVQYDGKKIFQGCIGCHGVDASKAALGKSQIIKGWDAAKIATALHGYKDGSYGGAMKAVMKGQASKLNDKEIEAVAGYISKL